MSVKEDQASFNTNLEQTLLQPDSMAGLAPFIEGCRAAAVGVDVYLAT